MSDDDRPRHLHADYAAQFRDVEVAAAYATRPPYPDGVIDTLAALIRDEPRIVLELGAGTGDITYRLAEHVARIDAVEPSAAMRAVAQAKRAASATIRWIPESAESFEAHGPYALTVAAESLHWMRWGEVLQKVWRHASPRAVLAIVLPRVLVEQPWKRELLALLAEHSTNRDYVQYDIVDELVKRGLFREHGRRTSVSAPFTQSLDDYVESFHSRNGFSRQRMSAAAAQSFDDQLRALVRRYRADEVVASPVESTVVWGSGFSSAARRA